MNKNNAAREKTPVAARVLNVVIAVLLVAAAIVCARMISQLKKAYDRDSYASIDYYSQQGDYAGMIYEYRRRNYDAAPFESKYEEEYEAAAYADAAFQKRYFEAAGNAARTLDLERRMEDARTKVGDLTPMLADIDRIVSELPKHK